MTNARPRARAPPSLGSLLLPVPRPEHGQTDRRKTDRRTDGRTDGRTDRRQAGRQTDRWADRQTVGPKEDGDRQTERRLPTHRQKEDCRHTGRQKAGRQTGGHTHDRNWMVTE